MLIKDCVQSFFVCYVELLKVWFLAADQLYAVDDLSRGIVEIVRDHDFVPSLQQRQRCKGANVASATSAIHVSV